MFSLPAANWYRLLAWLAFAWSSTSAMAAITARWARSSAAKLSRTASLRPGRSIREARHEYARRRSARTDVSAAPGLFDGTMMVAGIMIGSGIFLVSAEISRDVGGSGWLLAVWLLAGLMTILGALSYAELAAMMPHAGGQYVYLRAAYGPLPAFLYGWTSFLVIQTGTIAAVGVAFAKFMGVFAPALGARNPSIPLAADPALLWGVTFDNPVILTLSLPWLSEPLTVFKRTEFSISRGQLLAVAVIMGLTLWNLRGVREGKWVQNIFGVAKIGALILLIAIGLTMFSGDAIRSNTADLWGGIQRTTQYETVGKLVPASGLLLALMVMGGGDGRSAVLGRRLEQRHLHRRRGQEPASQPAAEPVPRHEPGHRAVRPGEPGLPGVPSDQRE